VIRRKLIHVSGQGVVNILSVTGFSSPGLPGCARIVELSPELKVLMEFADGDDYIRGNNPEFKFGDPSPFPGKREGPAQILKKSGDADRSKIYYPR
jgi:hypothetical protein